MATSRTHTALRAAGTAAAAGAAAGVYVTHRRHARSIASDPVYALLARPPVGRELTFPSADGTLLHAEVFGPDGAPTIVLAHGWTEALFYWIYQIRDLARGHLRPARTQSKRPRRGRRLLAGALRRGCRGRARGRRARRRARRASGSL